MERRLSVAGFRYRCVPLALLVFRFLLLGFSVEDVVGNGVPRVVNAAEQEQ